MLFRSAVTRFVSLLECGTANIILCALPLVQCVVVNVVPCAFPLVKGVVVNVVLCASPLVERSTFFVGVKDRSVISLLDCSVALVGEKRFGVTPLNAPFLEVVTTTA